MTVLLLACLVAGGYLLRVWGPVYLVQYEVKQVVRDYANQAVKNPSDAELRKRMVHHLATLDRLDAVDGDGRRIQIPAVNVREEEVTWERTQDPPQLHVAFEYTRPVRYPLIDRTDETTFAIDGTFDISRADWGTGR